METLSGLPLLRFCEAVAAPLVTVVVQKGRSVEETAKTIADLLAQTATTSVDIGRLMGPEGEGENARLALAALTAPLLAALYEGQGREIPKEADLARLMAAAGAAVTFAKGFEGSAVSAPDCVAHLAALAPLAQAFATKPMGEESAPMIAEVARKLTDKANTLQSALGIAQDDKAGQFTLIRALVPLYSACHRTAETAADAWAAFEMRCVMVEAIAKGFIAPPSTSDAQTGDKSPLAPQGTHQELDTAEPLPIRRSSLAPPKEGISPLEASPPKETPRPDSGPPANPMSFFKKKKDTE